VREPTQQGISPLRHFFKQTDRAKLTLVFMIYGAGKRKMNVSRKRSDWKGNISQRKKKREKVTQRWLFPVVVCDRLCEYSVYSP
jgi:hypothetical protein